MSVSEHGDRVSFLKKEQVMEVDFSDLTMDVSGTVNEIYDAIEKKLAATKQKWFFLVNYKNCKIMPEALITHAHRGKKVNLAYSLGSVRFAASDLVSEALMERSEAEKFDPNLYPDRKSALSHLAELRKQYDDISFAAIKKIDVGKKDRAYADRITIHSEMQIMEIDFDGLTFERSRHVNEFYDELEKIVAKSGDKWYFIINYRNCTILPEAWVAFATRGRQANQDYSLGSAQFITSSQMGEPIPAKPAPDQRSSSMLRSRDDAIEKIRELQAGKS